jgi:hypothetical protein
MTTPRIDRLNQQHSMHFHTWLCLCCTQCQTIQFKPNNRPAAKSICAYKLIAEDSQMVVLTSIRAERRRLWTLSTRKKRYLVYSQCQPNHYARPLIGLGEAIRRQRERENQPGAGFVRQKILKKMPSFV